MAHFPPRLISGCFDDEDDFRPSVRPCVLRTRTTTERVYFVPLLHSTIQKTAATMQCLTEGSFVPSTHREGGWQMPLISDPVPNTLCSRYPRNDRKEGVWPSAAESTCYCLFLHTLWEKEEERSQGYFFFSLGLAASISIHSTPKEK